MIPLFEDHTYELTDHERTVIMPMIVDLLRPCIGKDRITTARHIAVQLRSKHDIKIEGARIRKIVHVIRTESHIPCLIATQRGYYIATNSEEITTYIDSLYRRERAISIVRKSLIKQQRELH